MENPGVNLSLCLVFLAGRRRAEPGAGQVLDEARRAGRAVAPFPAADEDYFRHIGDNRVDLNIGLFSEEWPQHFRALAGGKRTTPSKISVARKNSVYWLVTETQTPDMALFALEF